MMRDLMKNPVVHVLFLGVIVAGTILVTRGPSSGDEERRVVISGGDLLQLRAAFTRTWQREPTGDELRGALDQHIRQEVLYREALARGYDRDDQVVRRAMQQKMEFLAASQALRNRPPRKRSRPSFRSARSVTIAGELTSLRSISAPTFVVPGLSRTRRRCWLACGPRIQNRRSSRPGAIRSC